jgi:hypothetical protein
MLSGTTEISVTASANKADIRRLRLSRRTLPPVQVQAGGWKWTGSDWLIPVRQVRIAANAQGFRDSRKFPIRQTFPDTPASMLYLSNQMRD